MKTCIRKPVNEPYRRAHNIVLEPLAKESESEGSKKAKRRRRARSPINEIPKSLQGFTFNDPYEKPAWMKDDWCPPADILARFKVDAENTPSPEASDYEEDPVTSDTLPARAQIESENEDTNINSNKKCRGDLHVFFGPDTANFKLDAPGGAMIGQFSDFDQFKS
jgi:hypothetical protein